VTTERLAEIRYFFETVGWLEVSPAKKYAVELLAEVERLQEERDWLAAYVERALDELGVPDENYPAPVSNAVVILRDGLRG
jgi:hypothetical protein